MKCDLCSQNTTDTTTTDQPNPQHNRENLCSLHYAKQLIQGSQIMEAEAKNGHIIAAIEALEDTDGLMSACLDMHMYEGLLVNRLGDEGEVLDLSKTIEARLIPNDDTENGEIIGFVEVPPQIENKEDIHFGLFPSYTTEKAKPRI